jgi:hypothetical protein
MNVTITAIHMVNLNGSNGIDIGFRNLFDKYY